MANFSIPGCIESNWMNYGWEESEEPVPYNCLEDEYGCSCGRGISKPNTPLKEKEAYIPWNYTSDGGDSWTNCDASVHQDHYKILYDKGQYIDQSNYEVCSPDLPPDNVQEYLQEVVHYPGGGPGYQYRTYSLTFVLNDSYWSDYWQCTRNIYTRTETFKFTYWLLCYSPDGPPIDPPPGWEWSGGGALLPIPEPEHPGIPEGPVLPPPEWLEPTEPGICPDCYTYDAERDLCIYTGGEGCEPIPCTETAGCDIDTPITGVCEGRDDCI